MRDITSSPRDDISRPLVLAYLRALYPPGSRGHFALGDKKVPRFFDAASGLEAAADHALTMDRTGVSVFSTVCAYSQPQRRQKLASTGAVLWVDIDRKSPGAVKAIGHAATNLPETVEDLVAILRPLPLEPSFVTDTGGGWHVYWRLDAPADLQEVRDIFKNTNKALQTQVIESARLAGISAGATAVDSTGASRGWHVDSLADLARFLRPAGTHNHKPGRDAVPRVSFLITPEEGPVYTFDALVKAFGGDALPKGAKRAPAAAPVVPCAPSMSSEEEPLTPEATQKMVRDKASRNRVLDRAPILRAFLDGRPFAARGERDSTAQKLASWLCFYTGGLGDVDALVAMGEPSLKAMADESPDDYLTDDQFRDKLERAMGDALRICRDGRIAEAAMRARLSGAFAKKFPPVTPADVRASAKG